MCLIWHKLTRLLVRVLCGIFVCTVPASSLAAPVKSFFSRRIVISRFVCKLFFLVNICFPSRLNSSSNLVFGQGQRIKTIRQWSLISTHKALRGKRLAVCLVLYGFWDLFISFGLIDFFFWLQFQGKSRLYSVFPFLLTNTQLTDFIITHFYLFF